MKCYVPHNTDSGSLEYCNKDKATGVRAWVTFDFISSQGARSSKLPTHPHAHVFTPPSLIQLNVSGEIICVLCSYFSMDYEEKSLFCPPSSIKLEYFLSNIQLNWRCGEHLCLWVSPEWYVQINPKSCNLHLYQYMYL